MMNLKLIQGDCLEVMGNISDGSVDAIITDPPYGTTNCKWDSIIPLEPMWEQVKRVIKKNGAIVMTASQPFTTTLIASNMKMFKYCWVWEKTRGSNFACLKYTPWKMHEDVVVFNAKGVYNPQKYTVDESQIDKRKTVNPPDSNKSGVYGEIVRTRKKDDGTRYPSSVVKISNPNNKTVHPTQKPVALGQYLIRTYTNENETVLDFTAGSGSFGVAAILENRNFIGIELDEKYFKIMENRIKKAKELDAGHPLNFG